MPRRGIGEAMALMPTPRSLEVAITSRCNLSCAYCYYANNRGVDYADLPGETWKRFFEEAAEAQVLSICVGGGEPLLRPDIRDLLECIASNRMRFEVLTNGTFVTEEFAQWLVGLRRCSSVQVSLDGSCAEVHEAYRGRGSFEPALRALRILVEAGARATVRCTVHAGNVEDLPRLAKLLLEDLGLPSFSTNAISCLGTRGKYDDGLFMTATTRLQAMRALSDLNAKYDGHIRATAGPLAEWRMFDQMEQARREGAEIPGRGKLTACGCVFERIAVLSDGTYVPCVMLPQVALGKIGETPLREAWTSPKLQAVRDRRSIPLSQFQECRDCAYVDLCTGNCPGTSLSMVNDANRPSPEGCLRRFRAKLEEQGIRLWET